VPAGKVMGWTAVGAGVAALALGGIAIVKEMDAGEHYDQARGMTGPGGDLVVGVTPSQFRSEVAAGDGSRHDAIVFGAAAGACVVSGVVLGFLAYRQTGEVGPFRF
jgi:hypothetical protein